ncbi:polysaccharide deacetylase family protein [Phenylobacterium sp.]|uniref:polysaccharide deacetylase family protein n=1 Tax=Phenylobacterium sp. TaxID=1871053 RepID=UPI002BDA4135|nr:polysaccharide deacetylase family protein [Phenylobacterium sp.]HLZ75486.1 polysaccharide deacetylase family protein [Phenylobacterium sp.]
MSAVTAVLYHNIAEQETPFEAGLGVTTRPEIFEQHLEFYRRNYDVIDLETLLSGNLPRRPLLITFDDCYRSVVSAAKNLLAPRDMPSVFFVNPTLVGGGISLDNLIAWASNTHGAAAVCEILGLSAEQNPTGAAIIANLLSACTAKQRLEIRRKLAAAFPISDSEMATRGPMLQAEDFPALRRLRVEIGNHTASHVHCGALDPDEYGDELIAAQTDLQRLSGGPIRSFSVAYGDERDLPSSVLETLRDSGHKAIFLVHGRSNIDRKASDIWYRVSFRNESVARMPLRLSIFPLMRTVRDRLRA